MLTDEQQFELNKYKTIEEIFSSPMIDAVANYRDIITSIFLYRELREPFIIETINRGHERMVAENLDAISLDRNWEIAKDNPKFKEILLKNFKKAIENSNMIQEYDLKEINLEDESLVINNWETIIKRTNRDYYSRKELISILNSTEEGKSIINSHFLELFYGDYPYEHFTKMLIDEGIVSKDKIADLILYDPTRMLKQDLELDSSRI